MYTSRLDLGTFDVVSGKLMITDPCYKSDLWCANSVGQVRNGAWNALAVSADTGEMGERIYRLVAFHEACPKGSDLTKRDAPFDVGVDSGQAGFFDAAFYRDDSVVAGGPLSEPGEAWYWHCCQITGSRLQAGVLSYGVVSSTGFGDGAYPCTLYCDPAGYIVKVEIEFISGRELRAYLEEDL